MIDKNYSAKPLLALVGVGVERPSNISAALTAPPVKIYILLNLVNISPPCLYDVIYESPLCVT